MSQQKLLSIFILMVLFLLVGCSGGTQEAPASTSLPPTNTSAPDLEPTQSPATEAPAEPTAMPEPTSEPPTPASEPTEEPGTTKVTFEFVTELETIEELDPIILDLEEVEGIVGLSGTEQTISITYDPDVLTEENIRTLMEQIGKPVK